MFGNEEWVLLEDFPLYEVSDHGRVKHVNYTLARRVQINSLGFPTVSLSASDGSPRRLRQVNKLILSAFDPEPSHIDGLAPAVWHIDGDFTNCRLDNLRWARRDHVLEWNRMWRKGETLYPPDNQKVLNQETGQLYSGTYDCAISEGIIESIVIWHAQEVFYHTPDHARYVYEGSETPPWRHWCGSTHARLPHSTKECKECGEINPNI